MGKAKAGTGSLRSSDVEDAFRLSRRKIALVSPHLIKMAVDFIYVFLEGSLCFASSSRQQEDHSAKNECGSADD